jgi:ATP adenylyltransferase
VTETLWAPWRMSYITGPKADGGCVLCRAAGAADDESRRELRVLSSRPTAFVLMNLFPYSHGHIMVVPRRHVSALDALEPDERRGLFELLVDAQKALSLSLNAQGLNVGMNLGKAAGAGIEDHVHIHVVPRWDGDTNFMPLLADARVMPQHLDDTFLALAGRFAALSAGAP